MSETKEWQDTYRSGAWLRDSKSNKIGEGKKMSTTFADDELTEMDGSFNMQVYQLSLQSAHARLTKLFLSIGSKEEKENWKDQVILLSDLIAKNAEMIELIAKRRVGL